MTIYLDLDGPLLDVSARYHAVYSSIVRDLGGRPIDRGTYWDLKRARRKEAEICRDRHPGVDPQAYSRLFLERIESPGFLARDRLVPGAASVLASMRLQHRLVLATLRRRGSALRGQLDLLGLDRLLDGVLQREDNDGGWRTKAEMILAEEVARGKPAPPGVLVGDTEGDLHAARAAGVVPVVVCNGIRSREALAPFSPRHLIETIEDLPPCLPCGAGMSEGAGRPSGAP